MTWSAKRWQGVRSQILTLQVAPAEYTVAPHGRLRDSRPPLLLLMFLCLLSCCCFSGGYLCVSLAHALVPVVRTIELVFGVENCIHSVPPSLSMALPIVQ